MSDAKFREKVTEHTTQQARGLTFGRVRERHRTHTRRVCDGVEVDTSEDDSDTSALVLRGDDCSGKTKQGQEQSSTETSGSSVSVPLTETEAGDEEENGQEGERDQEQVAASKSVDGVPGRDGKEEVECAETEGAEEGFDVAQSGLGEHGARVVRDNVDTAELWQAE